MAFIHPPILGFGRAQEKTASASVGAGVRVIPIASTSGYVAGDPVFISKSDDSGLQYLGAVESVALNVSITTEIETNASKGASAKIWQPGTYAKLQYNYGAPFSKTRDLGITNQVSRGGKVYAAQIADVVETLDLRFPTMWWGDWKRLRDFLVEQRSDGLKEFGLAFWDMEEVDPTNESSLGESRVVRARISDGALKHTSPRMGVVSVGVGFFVLEEGVWVEA